MCLAMSVVLASGAQLLFRFAMQGHEIGDTGLPGTLSVSAFNFTGLRLTALLGGIALYATSMVSWMLALVRFDVTVAYPMMSISYVIVYAAAVSVPFYDESISATGLLGITFIVTGVCLLPYKAHAVARTGVHNWE